MKNKIEKLRFSLCFCLARTRWGASSSNEKLRNTFKCTKCHLSQNHDNAVYKEFLQQNETECTLKTKDDSCEKIIGKLRFLSAIAKCLSMDISFFPTVHSLKTFPLLFTFFFFEITLSFLSKRQSVFAFLLSQAQVFLLSLTSDSVKLLIWETEISETWTCVPDVYPLSKLERKL